jgi:hypothetical protein
MDTYMTVCPECEGACEIRHPRWGSRSCPEPTIPCPLCHGSGEVSLDTAHDWDDEHEPPEPGSQEPDPAYAGEEEPF